MHWANMIRVLYYFKCLFEKNKIAQCSISADKIDWKKNYTAKLSRALSVAESNSNIKGEIHFFIISQQWTLNHNVFSSISSAIFVIKIIVKSTLAPIPIIYPIELDFLLLSTCIFSLSLHFNLSVSISFYFLYPTLFASFFSRLLHFLLFLPSSVNFRFILCAFFCNFQHKQNRTQEIK